MYQDIDAIFPFLLYASPKNDLDLDMLMISVATVYKDK